MVNYSPEILALLAVALSPAASPIIGGLYLCNLSINHIKNKGKNEITQDIEEKEKQTTREKRL